MIDKEVKESEESKEIDDVKEVKETKVVQKSNGFLDDIIEVCRWAKVKISDDKIVVDSMPTETASRQPTPVTFKKKWWTGKWTQVIFASFGTWLLIYPLLTLIVGVLIAWIITFIVSLFVTIWVLNLHKKKTEIGFENKHQPDNWYPSPGVKISRHRPNRPPPPHPQTLMSRSIGIGSSQQSSDIPTLEDVKKGMRIESLDVTAACSGSVFDPFEDHREDVDMAFEKMFDMKEIREPFTNDEIKKTLDDEHKELLTAQLDVATKEINDMLMQLRAFHGNTKAKKKAKGTGAH